MIMFFVVVVGTIIFCVLHTTGLIGKLIKKADKQAELKFPQRVKQLKALKKVVDDGSLQTKCEFYAGSYVRFNRRFWPDMVVGCLQHSPCCFVPSCMSFTHDPVVHSS